MSERKLSEEWDEKNVKRKDQLEERLSPSPMSPLMVHAVSTAMLLKTLPVHNGGNKGPRSYLGDLFSTQFT